MCEAIEHCIEGGICLRIQLAFSVSLLLLMGVTWTSFQAHAMAAPEIKVKGAAALWSRVTPTVHSVLFGSVHSIQIKHHALRPGQWIVV